MRDDVKEGLKVALVSAGVAVIFGGYVTGAVVTDIENKKIYKHLQQTMDNLSTRIETELTEKDDNLKNSKIEITALRASSENVQVGECKSDQLSVYGTITQQDDANKVFKIIFSTSGHEPFVSFYDIRKFCNQVSTANLESIAVTDYNYCFNENFSSKKMADIFVPSDNNCNNAYMPLFAEVGSYKKDGKTYGYVNYDGIYTKDFDGLSGYIVNTMSYANLEPDMVSGLYYAGGSSPNFYVKENKLTCEITGEHSKEEIYNEIMSKAQFSDASVTLECSYSGNWKLPTDYVENLNP